MHVSNSKDYTLKLKVETLLVFDRGFARAQYVIKFLKVRDIPFVMRVPRHVGITLDSSLKKLEVSLEAGWYPHILYQTQQQLPLGLYILRDAVFKDPMYLISNRLREHQIHHCYKRRMQMEHGFRISNRVSGAANSS